MKKLLFILATVVAFNVYAVDKLKPTAEQVHKVIKLTKRHIPIGRYFADDDDSEDDYSLTQPLLFRRQTAIKAHTDITPTEDDVQISDYARTRLFLARVQALEALQA